MSGFSHLKNAFQKLGVERDQSARLQKAGEVELMTEWTPAFTGAASLCLGEKKSVQHSQSQSPGGRGQVDEQVGGGW